MKRGWVNRLKEMTRSWASRIATSGRPGVASAARGQRFMAGGVKPYTPLQAAIDAVAKGSGRKFVERLLPHPPSWSRFRYLALRLVGLW